MDKASKHAEGSACSLSWIQTWLGSQQSLTDFCLADIKQLVFDCMNNTELCEPVKMVKDE